VRGARHAIALAAALGVVRGAPAAAAEWLTVGSRALPLGESAGPDAPVLGLTYGPRASSRIGGDVAIATGRSGTRTLRLGLAALVGFDNAGSRVSLPNEVGRTATELALAWAFDDWAARRLGPRGVLEVALALGRRSAFLEGRTVLPDAYRTDDVPFGAGGTYLALEPALRAACGTRWAGTLRLGFYGYLNGIVGLFGARVASDLIADDLHEGAAWQTSLEVRADRIADGGTRAFASLYAEAIGPHDDTAKHLGLVRGELGAALSSRALVFTPFLDIEAGHGPSLLVNRTELRGAVGVKLYAR